MQKRKSYVFKHPNSQQIIQSKTHQRTPRTPLRAVGGDGIGVGLVPSPLPHWVKHMRKTQPRTQKSRHVTKSQTDPRDPHAKQLFSPRARKTQGPSSALPHNFQNQLTRSRNDGKKTPQKLYPRVDPTKINSKKLGTDQAITETVGQKSGPDVAQLVSAFVFSNESASKERKTTQSNVQQDALAMPRGVPYYPVVLESQGDEMFRIPASTSKPPPSGDPVLVGQFYRFLNKRRPANSMGLALKARSAYKRRVAEVSTMY